MFKQEEFDDHVRDLKKKKGALSAKEQRDINTSLRRAARERDLARFLMILRADFGLKDEDPEFQNCVKWWHQNQRR